MYIGGLGNMHDCAFPHKANTRTAGKWEVLACMRGGHKPGRMTRKSYKTRPLCPPAAVKCNAVAK